jgi:hypothetical protein
MDDNSRIQETGSDQGHPAWCDLTRCTADPVSQADGYRSGVGGEHRSAAIPVDLRGAFCLPVREAAVWLSEACAPWRCATYLRIGFGETELSMPIENGLPALDALAAMLASAASREEVGQ